MWDYEHIILEQFPEIYKVRCINHTKLHRDEENKILADNELKPGHVLVVPIPFINEKSAVDPLRPYTKKKTLAAISLFLRNSISPFVKLEVQNPKIEEVQVFFRVAFTDAIDDLDFYVELLNSAIVNYLTPWTISENVNIDFGGRWYKSSLINFVEELDYVDYVKDFEMYHKKDIEQNDSSWNKLDSEIIEATTSRSVLVSHKKHDIRKL